jgi:hypothetical protein
MKGVNQYEPTGAPASFKSIIAGGGDLFGAASIFLNPIIRGAGNVKMAYDVVTNTEMKNYANEADIEAKAAKKGAKSQEDKDFEKMVRNHEIVKMDYEGFKMGLDLQTSGVMIRKYEKELKLMGKTPKEIKDILGKFEELKGYINNKPPVTIYNSSSSVSQGKDSEIEYGGSFQSMLDNFCYSPKSRKSCAGSSESPCAA